MVLSVRLMTAALAALDARGRGTRSMGCCGGRGHAYAIHDYLGRHDYIERGVRVSRGSATWLRRGSFIAILLAVAITPGPASAARPCPLHYCQSAGTVRWERLLPGAWVAAAGVTGTVPAQGAAYAAIGSEVAAVGVGTAVYAYGARGGNPLWTTV